LCLLALVSEVLVMGAPISRRSGDSSLLTATPQPMRTLSRASVGGLVCENEARRVVLRLTGVACAR
jgi:hypothetical protein